MQKVGAWDADEMEKDRMKGAPCGVDVASCTDDELMVQLKTRAAGCRQKSMTARLAAVIDLIETLLSRGYDRSQAREVLIETGWHFTPDSFDSALSRVRKRHLRATVLDEQTVSMTFGKNAALEGDNASNQASSDSPRSMADIFAQSTIFRSPQWPSRVVAASRLTNIPDELID